MKRLTFILFALLITSSSLYAQERARTPIGGRPDVKGDLFLDFGFNLLNNRPTDLNTRFFASRTFNVYYQRPFNIGENTGLTFNPGIGLGLEKLSFQRDQMLINDPERGPNSSELVNITSVYGENISINGHTTAANYIDIPLELRYHLNKTDYSKGFRFAVGAKVGVLFDAHSKVSFETEEGLSRTVKDKQNLGFSPIRYGVYTRVGFGGFNVWSYYGLNSVWRNEQGPFNTEANQFNFGISVALF
ncbi:porin family protein [Litoribacter populi]|uniref:porin family protein n=1 Tax=Litoribacter populi TaxID=2598460 RepID=UPI0011816A15|nr:porin family protein [Litoribacter populi]